MKRLLIALVVMASALTITVSDAEAKRLGGGGSFGRQSQSVTRQAPAPSQAQRPGAPAAAPAPAQTPQGMPRPASPWRNILGGALLGLGLGALLSHFGLGGAMAGLISTVLMIALLALAAMFIVRLFRRNSGEQPRPAWASGADGSSGYSNYSGTPEIGSRLEPSVQPAALQGQPAASSSPSAPWGVPADFDVPAFLRNAKTYFIRLQEDWDRADINDIREFTTSEMFAELKLQLQERGATPNKTDVVSLDAELLGIETVGDEYLASVKFSGMIREEETAPAAPFSEVWNLIKPISRPGGWVLAGIQQVS